MKKDRFDLEQEMLRVWHITDDMEDLYDAWESLADAQKLDILRGMIDLYQFKFEKMFNTFEQCIQNREFNRTTYESMYSEKTQGNVP